MIHTVRGCSRSPEAASSPCETVYPCSIRVLWYLGKVYRKHQGGSNGSDDALGNRRSVRAFSDEPVPRQLLERILSEASRAPSAINMQPWEVHVVIGEERKRLSRRLLRSFKERGLTCGPGTTNVLPDAFMNRAREVRGFDDAHLWCAWNPISRPTSMRGALIFTRHLRLPCCS